MTEERLKGNVREGGTGWVTREWPRILRAHAEELPDIEQYWRGSFNIDLTDPPIWRPPNEGFFYARSRGRCNGSKPSRDVAGDMLDYDPSSDTWAVVGEILEKAPAGRCQSGPQPTSALRLTFPSLILLGMTTVTVSVCAATVTFSALR
jgi:hypothetical protein